MARPSEDANEIEGSSLLQSLGVTALNVAAVERDVIARAAAENATHAAADGQASDDGSTAQPIVLLVLHTEKRQELSLRTGFASEMRCKHMTDAAMRGSECDPIAPSTKLESPGTVPTRGPRNGSPPGGPGLASFDGRRSGTPRAGPGDAAPSHQRCGAERRLRAVDREIAAVQAALASLDEEDREGQDDEEEREGLEDVDAWSDSGSDRDDVAAAGSERAGQAAAVRSEAGSAAAVRSEAGPAAAGGEPAAEEGRQGLEQQRQLQRAVLTQRLADLEARQAELADAAAEEAEGAGPQQERGREGGEPGASLLMEDDALDAELDASGRGSLLETKRDRLIRLVKFLTAQKC